MRVGRIALSHNIQSLSADFNCTVTEPAYVNEILDALARDHAAISQRLLYVEQLFPYDIENISSTFAHFHRASRFFWMRARMIGVW